MGTITAANAAFFIAAADLFDNPVQLQGFAADDIFDTEGVDNAEALIGVDGIASYGFVYQLIKQSITLQADSASIDLFDQIWNAEQASAEKVILTGNVTLSSVVKKWTMTNGIMSNYKPMPDAGRILKPQKFQLTWNTINPAPL